MPIEGTSAEAALYHHGLSGHCTAHVAPKVAKPRVSRHDREAASTFSMRLNDWLGMFDG